MAAPPSSTAHSPLRRSTPTMPAAETQISCLLPLARRTENLPQSLSNNYFFSRLNGHGNQLDMILFFDLFGDRPLDSFAHRGDQTRIIHAEHFDHRIAVPQFLHAVGN